MRETKRSGLVSKIHAELGTRKDSWMLSQRDFLELEKVLGRLFADTRHPEKKNLQASQSSPAMSWQPLKASVESGGLSIRPGYSHSQSGPTAGIWCQVPTGVRTTHRSCPIHTHHILVRQGVLLRPQMDKLRLRAT